MAMKRPDLKAIRERAGILASLAETVPDEEGDSRALDMAGADLGRLLSYVDHLEAERDHYRALGILDKDGGGQVDLHDVREHAATDDDRALARFARTALPLLCDELTRRDAQAEQARAGELRALAGNARILAGQDRLRQAAEALVRAVDDPGPRPDVHAQTVGQTVRAWPALMRQVDQLRTVLQRDGGR